MTWPNFFIVGGQKCGTYTLHEYLNQTHGVYMAPDKAPNYFSKILIPDDFVFPPIRSEKEYLALFDDVKDETAIGEASATYLADPEAPKLIHEKVPDAKIIISLRDPIERAYSHYHMFRTRSIETDSFSTSIEKYVSGNPKAGLDYVGGGMYLEQIQRYWDTFGRDSVKILFFEETIKDVPQAIRKLLKFLNVNSEPPTLLKDEGYNKYGKPRGKIVEYLLNKPASYKIARKLFSPKTRSYIQYNLLMKNTKKPLLSEEDRSLLQNTYRENTIKLSEILGRKIPWKNFPELQ